METNSRTDRAKGVWTDPAILLSSAISAFGLIGIVDSALSWRAFFQSFLSYWLGFRDALFSLIPLRIPSDFKDIIIINCAAAAIILRSGYIMQSRGVAFGGALKYVTLWTVVGSTIYGFLFFPVLLPIREAVRRLIHDIPHDGGILKFLHDSMEVSMDEMFLIPIMAPVAFVFFAIYEGIRHGPPGSDGRTMAVALLSNTMLVLAFVAAIILLCARW